MCIRDRYISFESKKVKPELQKKVRLYGIFGAVVLRILILVTILPHYIIQFCLELLLELDVL